MIRKALDKLGPGGLARKALDHDKRDVAMTVGGMGLLLAGAKIPGLVMFGLGAAGIERQWREAHPDFRGGFSERWGQAASFYERTHQDPTNRALHIVGIPMIVGGAVGLLAFRPIGLTAPLWWGAAGSFGAGWVLNIVGHGAFEKNAPAFTDDPLSFVAGPVWDVDQLRKKIGVTLRGQIGRDASATA